MALMAKLVMRGEAHLGYHPEAEAIHAAGADYLMEVFDAHGWPGPELAGEEGAAAAMMLLQNARPRPAVMRRGLELMMDAQPRGQANPLDIAFLTDLIRSLEGKPQVFGTQLDWGEDGKLRAAALAEPAEVDARRRMMGLGPLSEAIAATNAELKGQGPPPDLDARRAAYAQWAAKVGWR